MAMIFVNLPVSDLTASREFFGRLGYEFNEDFSNEEAACMVVDGNIFVMLLVEDRFRDFIDGEIARDGTEALIALAADSRDHVDEIVEKAIAAGGKAVKKTEEGPMYSRSFRDLDGHLWEPVYMDMGAAG